MASLAMLALAAELPGTATSWKSSPHFQPLDRQDRDPLTIIAVGEPVIIESSPSFLDRQKNRRSRKREKAALFSLTAKVECKRAGQERQHGRGCHTLCFESRLAEYWEETVE
jgi:hypothetical protein